MPGGTCSLTRFFIVVSPTSAALLHSVPALSRAIQDNHQLLHASRHAVVSLRDTIFPMLQFATGRCLIKPVPFQYGQTIFGAINSLATKDRTETTATLETAAPLLSRLGKLLPPIEVEHRRFIN